jgi:HSP20 family protein
MGMQDEMSRIFDNFLGWPRRYALTREDSFTPRVNVEEGKDRFLLTAEVPGMEKDDIKIEVKDHQLMITGEKKMEAENKETDYHVCEICYGRFERSFTLPDNVNADKIEAAYKSGVLTLTIPKTEEAKPKEIKVKIT